MNLRESFKKETELNSLESAFCTCGQTVDVWNGEYILWLEKELKKLRVTDVSGMLKSFISYAESRSISDINITDDTIEYFIEDFNLH